MLILDCMQQIMQEDRFTLKQASRKQIDSFGAIWNGK